MLAKSTQQILNARGEKNLKEEYLEGGFFFSMAFSGIVSQYILKKKIKLGGVNVQNIIQCQQDVFVMHIYHLHGKGLTKSTCSPSIVHVNELPWH